MMKSKTIVLWGREDLLSSSVEIFLTTQKGWRVINISNEENFDALLVAINKVHPDVVIIHLGNCTGVLNLPTELFRSLPDVKVITLSSKDNLIEIYNKQNVIVRSASDLISAIEADTAKSNSP